MTMKTKEHFTFTEEWLHFYCPVSKIVVTQ